MTLKQLQAEQKEWTERNFPGQKKHQCLLGMIEELGELAHCHLKAEQNIRGDTDKHAAAAKDAIGDVVVYMAGYCTAIGLDLEECARDCLKTRVPLFGGPAALLCASYWLGQVAGKHVEQSGIPPSVNAKPPITRALQTLLAYCAVMNYDFNECIEGAWAQVKQRDWVSDSANGGTKEA